MTRPNILILFAALLIAGCAESEHQGANADQPRRITLRLLTYQLSPAFDDYMTALCASYESLHPDTGVEWLDAPADGYLDKVQLMFRGGDPPDVINLTYDIGLHMAQQGVLEDVRPLVSPEIIASYFPRIIESGCTWQSEVYGLPWYLSPSVMLCNRAIMREAGIELPPRTHAELLAMSRTIRERCPAKFGFFELLTESGHLRDFLVINRVPLVERDALGQTRAAFNTPEGVAVLRTWADAYREGALPRESIIPDLRRAIELYKSGRCAFFITGPQFLREIRSDAPDVYASTDVAPVLETPLGAVGVDIMSLGVADHGDTPEARDQERRAAALAAFVTNGPNQLAFCRRVTIFPSVMEAARDPHFTADDGTLEGKARVIAAGQLERAELFREPFPRSSELNAAMSEAMEQACLGTLTPEAALAQAEQRWNEILMEAAPASESQPQSH